jgi:formylglycine-generating enzyme required for sulfatase activity
MDDLEIHVQQHVDGLLRIWCADADGCSAPEDLVVSDVASRSFDALRQLPIDECRARAARLLHETLLQAPEAWHRIERHLPEPGDRLPPVSRIRLVTTDESALRLPFELLARATDDLPPVAAGRLELCRLCEVADPSGPPASGEPRALVVVGAIGQPHDKRDGRLPVLDLLRGFAPRTCVRVAVPAPTLRVLCDAAQRNREHQSVADFLGDPSRCVPLPSVGRLLELLRDEPADIVAMIGHGLEQGEDTDPRAHDEATAFDLGLPRDHGRPPGPDFDELADALQHGATRLLAVCSCLVGPGAALALLRSVDHVLATSARVTVGEVQRALDALRDHLLDERQPIDRVLARMRGAFGPRSWALAHFVRTRDPVLLRDPVAEGLRDYIDSVRAAWAGFVRSSMLLLDDGESPETGTRRYVDESLQVQVGRDDDGAAREYEWQDRTVAPLFEPTGLANRLEAARADGAHLAVLGRPGGGKSAMLQKLCFDLASEEPLRLVPVLVRLRDHADHGAGLDLLREAVAHLRGIAADHVDDSDPMLRGLRSAEQSRRIVLLLDGLDEVDVGRRDAASRRLATLARSKGCTVVLTSRPIGFENPGGYRELWLQALDRRAQARLVTERHGAELWTRFSRLLWSRPSLEHLAGNPLFLTLMADLVAASDAELPAREFDVLRAICKALIGQTYRPRAERRPFRQPALVREALEELAHAMTLAAAARWDDLRIERWSAQRPPREAPPPAELERALRSSGDWGDAADWSEFLLEVGRRTGLLVSRLADGRRIFEFRHRALQEYLCACALLRQVPGLDLGTIRARLGEGAKDDTARARAIEFWAEPIGMLAGEVDHPDRWVLALCEDERTRGIALRAVAAARALEPETVLAVVEALPEWEDRVEVYAGLAERVDRARLLDLVQRLCVRTRNGNDLWHLRALLVRLGDGGMPGAPELAARVYAHVPPPDPELFAWIPGREQDREPLWRLCPSGTFTMGEYDDTAEVVIPDPFWMMAVTVTVAMYRSFDPDKRHRWGDGARLPQTEVTWFEASAFCGWLNTHGRQLSEQLRERTGLDLPVSLIFRLPDEAEWEYACRAGSSHAFCSGRLPKDPASGRWLAWSRDNPDTDSRVHEVAELPSNVWGIHDMHGNVWEWGMETLSVGSIRDRVRSDGRWIREIGTLAGQARCARGGSYGCDARRCTATERSGSAPHAAWVGYGFRPRLAAAEPGDRLSSAARM